MISLPGFLSEEMPTGDGFWNCESLTDEISLRRSGNNRYRAVPICGMAWGMRNGMSETDEVFGSLH